MRRRAVLGSLACGIILLAIAPARSGAEVHATASNCRPAGLSQVNDDNWLNGVSVVSACDAWAVGGYSDARGGGGLIEHWNGYRWIPQLIPGIEQLYAVSALSRTDAWAVGSNFPPGQIDHALALHWNGTVWHAVPVPNAGHTASSTLYGVSAVSPRDIWAVGGYQSGGRGNYRDLIEHWNGHAWHRVQGPRRSVVADQILESVTAVTSTMVWASGGQNVGPGTQGAAALIRWDGTHWHKVRLPAPAHADSFGLEQVAAGSPRDAWAVGSSERLWRTASGCSPRQWPCTGTARDGSRPGCQDLLTLVCPG